MRREPILPPPAVAEGSFYAYMAYVNLSPVVGLEVPMLGILSLMTLAVYLALRRGSRVDDLLKMIALPLLCALSFMAVQILIHGEDITADYLKECPAWIFGLIVIHSLCLRTGFLQRFPLAMFVIGLPALQSLRYNDWGMTTDAGIEVMRVAAGGPLRNANGMAFWFGFCFVCFVVIGLETRRMTVRLASWLAAITCLGLVGITVSRGILLAMALACIIAFRRLLKRSFVPLVILFSAGWLITMLGVFDNVVGFYSARGMEETGRFLVWPLAIERFFTWPFWLTGVGVSDVGIFVASKGIEVTPHNSFLFLALAGGVIPLLLYLAYWVRAASGLWEAYRTDAPDALFVLPLFIYIFLAALGTNVLFVEFPMIVTLAAAMGAPNQLAQARVARYRPERRSLAVPGLANSAHRRFVP